MLSVLTDTAVIMVSIRVRVYRSVDWFATYPLPAETYKITKVSHLSNGDDKVRGALTCPRCFLVLENRVGYIMTESAFRPAIVVQQLPYHVVCWWCR